MAGRWFIGGRGPALSFNVVLNKALRLAQSDQRVDESLARFSQKFDAGEFQVAVGFGWIALFVVAFLHHSAIRSWKQTISPAG